MPGIYYCHQGQHAADVLLYSEVRVGAPDGGGLVGPIETTPMCPDCTIEVVRSAVRREWPTDPDRAASPRDRLHRTLDLALDGQDAVVRWRQNPMAVSRDGEVWWTHSFEVNWSSRTKVEPSEAERYLG